MCCKNLHLDQMDRLVAIVYVIIYVIIKRYTCTVNFKVTHWCKMFGFNITSETIMPQCWELDKNTFITCYLLYNMNKKVC